MNSQKQLKGNVDRDFSVELNSSKNLTRLSTSNDSHRAVLIEGTLGKLRHAAFVESTILEVEGDCGVLRLSVRKNEITNPTQSTEDKKAKEEQQ